MLLKIRKNQQNKIMKNKQIIIKYKEKQKTRKGYKKLNKSAAGNRSNSGKCLQFKDFKKYIRINKSK